MSFFSRTSLGFRLLSAFIITIVVVLTAMTASAILHERRKARQELMNKGEMLTGMLSLSSRVGVFAESRDMLKDVAAGMVSEPDVVLVGIYNAGFKPLYLADKKPGGDIAVFGGKTGGRAASEQDGPAVRETESTMEFTKPVRLKLNPNKGATLYFGDKDAAAPTKTIGYVRVVLDKKTLNREVLNILKRNAVLALLFISASVIVVYLSVRKITRPLKTLTRNVKELGRGNDIAPMPVASLDEIGKLSTAFNAMVEERAGAEHALRESEKKYRELFEEAINPVFISTPAGKFLDINRAGLEFFACADKEELLALNIQDLYLNPENREAFKRIVEHKGSIKDYEVKLNTKNGELRSVVITATAVRDKTGAITAYRGMLRDVTTERSLEEQLRHAQKMEAVGRLTGGVAHDFNNILTAIISYAYHLQIKLAKAEDPLGVYAENIIAAGEKASDLIRSLLIFSRKQLLNPKPVDLNEIIRGHADILTRLINDDTELAMRLRDDPMIINADRGQIELMLMNFVANARDALPGGGRIVIKTDTVHFQQEDSGVPGPCKPGEYAALSVADTGVGMDAATQRRIFEPFFTTKEQGKGTGLGLSLVYGIVKQHNGHIDVTSVPLQGTTFTVYLPLQDVGTPLVSPQDKSPRAKGVETILIAEDSGEEREFAGSILEEFGYLIVKAVDGEEALRKFHEQRDVVNLLLLDMVMPHKNGMQVYVEAKKSRPDLKAVFITGYPADRYDLGGHDDADLHFLVKPVSPRQLLQKVREVLDS